MSILAALIYAWVAVYAFLTSYFLALGTFRRGDRTYLVFGLLCASMGLYAFGMARAADAREIADGVAAQRLQWLGALPAAALLVHFAQLTSGVAQLRVRRAAYACAALGWVACLAGLFFDPDRPADRSHPLVTIADISYQVGGTTEVGWAFMIGAASATIYAAVIVCRASGRGGPLSRPVAITLCILCLAAVHDVLVNAGLVRNVFLLEHASLLFGIVVCFALLREFIRMGEELGERTAELRRYVDELRATQEELVTKEQLAAVGELAGVIAHEVRNPLAVIANAVAGLRRQPLGDPDREVLLGILDEEAARLNRLVGDLLAYARPMRPQKTTVELRPCLDRAVEVARRANPMSDTIQVRYELDGHDKVTGDEDLLRQAFTNVAENAFQAMPAGGELTVSTSETQDEAGTRCIAVSFSDTGEGMDTLVRSKALSPFFSTRPMGTGLGLAIVARITRAHGGATQIDSRHGEGATIRLLLPE